MAFDKEKFWREIQLTPARKFELSEAERDELERCFGSTIFRHALSVAFQEIHAHGSQVLALDLSGSEGVARAMNLQGRAQGTVRFLEAILEQLDEPSTDEENTDG